MWSHAWVVVPLSPGPLPKWSSVAYGLLPNASCPRSHELSRNLSFVYTLTKHDYIRGRPRRSRGLSSILIITDCGRGSNFRACNHEINSRKYYCQPHSRNIIPSKNLLYGIWKFLAYYYCYVKLQIFTSKIFSIPNNYPYEGFTSENYPNNVSVYVVWKCWAGTN